MPLEPAAIDALSILIGDGFGPDELDIVMRKTTGAGLFKAWVGPGKPMRDTVLELLRKLSDRGIERAVLTEVALRRRTDAPLTDAIRTACPEALEALPATAAQVGALLTGLAAASASLADPAVRAALAASKGLIGGIAETVGTLRTYKEIHDCLHQLQFRQLSDLRGAARALGEDPLREAELVDYQTRLDTACASIDGWIADLPEAGLTQQLERAWLDRLAKANADLRQALADRKPGPAQVALSDVARILATVPSRLNEQIVVAADALGLEKLGETLGGIRPALTGGAGDQVETAGAALNLLAPALHSRVAEHRAWQEIDIRIGYIDDLCDHRGPDALAEFAIYWPDLKRAILDLAAYEPEAQWAKDTGLYAGRLDDQIAREAMDDALVAAFAIVRVKARFRFFAVDQSLKSECGALIAVSAPLQSLVAELSHD
ncbi:hypothetical protein [Frigidibacter sp. SD6-1]|uniref:hypothetical protein n=1 Tax=Frigidibacter sp. SD6-1 TaxID=3032581 RepID=UPI0024DFBE6C|nr:hypothetical protein [Frigidibacter sp. SD6-1]